MGECRAKVAMSDTKRLNIVVASLPEMGHANPVFNVACELSRRGHDVTFASCAFLAPRLAEQCGASGVRFAPLASDLVSSETEGSDTHQLRKRSPIELYMVYNARMREGVLALVDEIKPDVIVADYLTICAAEVGDAVGVPVVVNFADSHVLNMVGPRPSRLQVMLVGTLAMPFVAGVSCLKGPQIARLMWGVVSSFYTRLCLVSSAWGVQPSVPMPPNIFFTGPTGPRPVGPVVETSCPELNDWIAAVRRSGRRIVYISFGSMVSLSAQQVQCVYQALVDMPGVAVAWSLKKSDQAHLPDRPSHFFVNTWFPQAEVLLLPDVRAAVLHCGWGGLMEVALAGKPIVAVPFFGDQGTNANIARERGIAEVVQPQGMTPARLRNALQKVMEKEAYAASAQRLQRAMQPSGGARAAAEQVESLAKYGCEHITLPAPPAVHFGPAALLCTVALVVACGAALGAQVALPF